MQAMRPPPVLDAQVGGEAVTMPLFGAEQEVVTTDDYYTPRWLFKAMGIGFDLDVAAPPGGVPWIPADDYFTLADDGLAQEWRGRVWMNPPFSNLEPWSARFCNHRRGIAILPTSKAAWFDDVWRGGAALAMLPGTFRFNRDLREKGSSIWMPVMLAAFEDTCIEAISRVGRVR